MPDPVDLCDTTTLFCRNLLHNIGCPSGDQVILSCRDGANYNTYEGVCSCVGFDTERIRELIVDSQVKSNITNGMVAVWPSHAASVAEPTEVFDFCLTYDICATTI